MKTDLLIAGIGNRFRRDDAAGLMAARRLSGRNIDGVTVIETSADGAGLMDAWEGYDSVILVDAVSAADRAPGDVVVIDPTHEPVPDSWRCGSTHVFGLGQAVEMARALNRLPRNMRLVGIVGEKFGMGEGVSEAAMEGVFKAEKTVLDLVNGWKRKKEADHA